MVELQSKAREVVKMVVVVRIRIRLPQFNVRVSLIARTSLLMLALSICLVGVDELSPLSIHVEAVLLIFISSLFSILVNVALKHVLILATPAFSFEVQNCNLTGTEVRHTHWADVFYVHGAPKNVVNVSHRPADDVVLL